METTKIKPTQIRIFADMSNRELLTLEYMVRNYVVLRLANSDTWHYLRNAIAILLGMTDEDKLKDTILTDAYLLKIRESIKSRGETPWY